MFQLALQDLGKHEKPGAAETKTPKAHLTGSWPEPRTKMILVHLKHHRMLVVALLDIS